MGQEVVNLFEERMENSQLVLMSLSTDHFRTYFSDVPIDLSYDDKANLISVDFKNGMNMEIDLNGWIVFDDIEREFVLKGEDTRITFG